MDRPEQPVLQLHTTVFRVRNLERSREFFVTKLGMTVVYEDLHYKLISLQLGRGSLLTLWELRPEERGPAAAATPPAQNGIHSMYMVIYCRDVAAYRVELMKKGVPVEPIFDRETGLRLFWFNDPDNNRFCVLQFLPE